MHQCGGPWCVLGDCGTGGWMSMSHITIVLVAIETWECHKPLQSLVCPLSNMDSKSQLLKHKVASRPGPDIIDLQKPQMQPKPLKDMPKIFAQSPKLQSCKNLTLVDWMMVYAYVDEHPGTYQQQIVKYFKTLSTRALVFNQSTLFHKLHKHPKMEAHVTSYPNALLKKKAHSVIWLDIEWALVLWMHHIQGKDLTVTGPLLQEKWSQFEKKFNIPDEEKLTGGSWVQNFVQPTSFVNTNIMVKLVLLILNL